MWVKSKRWRKKKKKKRANDGNNNGQATHGARKPPGPKYFFCIYLLVMPKYWGEQIFTHGRFPEVDQKQKAEKKERKILQGLGVAQAAVTEPWP